MVIWFTGVIILVVLQRIVELIIAKKNADYAKSLGGYEVGKEHYLWLVLMHGAFFCSLVIETILRGNHLLFPVPIFFMVFLLAQILRIWVIFSLGRMWNTRIIIIPESAPVTWGPYRYMRHPNYLVVILEIVTLPLAFGAVYTAIVFSALNILLLMMRIRVEEEGLNQIPAFKKHFNSKIE